jgi:hypothetical protein
MIKLLNIIEEGTLILTPDERQQVEAMIPEIIKVISEPDLIPLGRQRNIGTLKYKYADGEDGEVLIGVGTYEPANSRGAHWPMDRNNKTDNLILIQQAQFKQYFPSNKFNQIDQKLYRTFSGTANTGVERLRQVLKHEIIHAKDPALHHHYSKEPYDSSDESVYFKSWTEFQTFTGQFFESLIAGTDRVLSGVNTAADLKTVESALANILQFFAGKTKTMSVKTAEFIDGTGSRNIFQKVFNFLGSIAGRSLKSSDFALHEYVLYLNKIKQYNPEGYKEFLKDLYKTIKTIEEKVNSTSPIKIKVQEMKQNINEVKRMQLLAGIINESQLNEEEKSIADPNSGKLSNGLSAGLSALENGIEDIKLTTSEKQIDESVALTVAGLFAGFPGLVKLIGNTVDAVIRVTGTDYFLADTADKMGANVNNAVKLANIGKNIAHWGEEKEEEYLTALKALLLKLRPDLEKEQDKLENLSKKLYAVILACFAGASAYEAFNAETIIKKAAESGLAVFKTAEASELVGLAKKIAAQSSNLKTILSGVSAVASKAPNG